MFYYTFSQGFRRAPQPQEQREVKIDVIRNGSADVADASPTCQQYNKPYTYPPDTLVNNESAGRRMLATGSWSTARRTSWTGKTSHAYYGNTTFGVGTRLSDQGRRLQIVARVHRRPDSAGFDFAQQRVGDQLAVHQVVEPG